MRPRRLVLVVGTGTDVGKTWVSAHLLATLRAAGLTVAARKPAQSFDPGDDPAAFDSAVLGAASGEPSESVCRPGRWYEIAMAPPMAADALGRDPFTVAELVEEVSWPPSQVEVGLVETAGGVRSPQAHDGDAVALSGAFAPDIVVLVADAGLGTINAVRLSAGAICGDGGAGRAGVGAGGAGGVGAGGVGAGGVGAGGVGAGGVGAGAVGASVVVVLNRFDAHNDLHVRNRRWLTEQDNMYVVAVPGEEKELAALVRGR